MSNRSLVSRHLLLTVWLAASTVGWLLGTLAVKGLL